MAKACATCGSELREGARVCTQCGTPVAAAPTAQPTAAQTMIGFTSPLAPASKVESAPPQPAPAPAPMNQTMLGFSAPDLRAPPPAPAPTPARVPAGAQTMLGIAAPGLIPTSGGPGVAPRPASAPAPAPAPVAAPAPAPAPKPALGGTMLGVAMPGIAPAHSQPIMTPPPAGSGAPAQPIPARTMLLEQPPPIVPAPAPLAPETAPAAPVVVSRRGVPLAIFAVLALVLVLGVGGAILYFSRGAPPMTATAKV